jgi:hypothetical protein
MSSRDDAILWDVRIRLTLHERGLADDEAVRWWDEPSPALDGRNPIHLWKENEYERVFEAARLAPESAR